MFLKRTRFLLKYNRLPSDNVLREALSDVFYMMRSILLKSFNCYDRIIM